MNLLEEKWWDLEMLVRKDQIIFDDNSEIIDAIEESDKAMRIRIKESRLRR